MIHVILSIILGYLLGSIPFSYLIPKLLKGIDIRNYRSGNIGGSNVIRTVGFFPGIAAALLDVLKAMIAIWILKSLGWGLAYQAISGISAIIGHNWSLYLRFSGGRGIACTIGVLALLLPRELLVIFLILLIGFVVKEGGGSVFIALILLPFLSLFFREPASLKSTALILTLIALLRRVFFVFEDRKKGLPLKKTFFNRLLYDAPFKEKLKSPTSKPKSGDDN